METRTRSGLHFKNFDNIVDSKQISLFVISNRNGLEACITNFGLRLVSLMVPDRKQVFSDIVLGHKTLQEYMSPKSEFYFGAVIGRYANRIAEGRFLLEGKKYALDQNNGANHLHGGPQGFHNVIWDAKRVSDQEIAFTYLSRHMEEGYPGNLQLKVNYNLNDNNELIITYKATTDETTIVNLTHHSYFNLKGEGQGSIEDHRVRINANHFTPIKSGGIPTGEINEVKNTPFDFTKCIEIREGLYEDDSQLILANGFDHNFVLNHKLVNKGELIYAAEVEELTTGRIMKVHTTEPGLQFYTGNFLNGSSKGKNDIPHHFRSGFCLETQHFPDSPNQSSFPSTLLKPQNEYSSVCVYSFE